MYGSGYVIEHCISALKKEQQKKVKEVQEKAYRIYVTDALKVIAENTAHFAGGSTMSKRWMDIIEPKPEETRTGDEITVDIKEKLRKMGGKTR